MYICACLLCQWFEPQIRLNVGIEHTEHGHTPLPKYHTMIPEARTLTQEELEAFAPPSVLKRGLKVLLR